MALYNHHGDTSGAPFPHYRSLIDWKLCLCTISLVDRDQYSGAGSSIRDRDLCERCVMKSRCNIIDRDWGQIQVKASIKTEGNIFKGQMTFFYSKAEGTEGNKEGKIVLSVLVVSYQQQHTASHTMVALSLSLSLSHTHTHTFDSQIAARTPKGQKQSGQLVFSQLICQSGPQTSAHVTVNLPDKSRQRGGGAARTVAPSHSPPPGQRTQMARATSPKTPVLPAMGAVCPATHPELMWHGHYAARRRQPFIFFFISILFWSLLSTFLS